MNHKWFNNKEVSQIDGSKEDKEIASSKDI